MVPSARLLLLPLLFMRSLTLMNIRVTAIPAPADAVLDQVVSAGRGSARTIFTDIEMHINQAKKTGQAPVAKIANLRS